MRLEHVIQDKSYRGLRRTMGEQPVWTNHYTNKHLKRGGYFMRVAHPNHKHKCGLRYYNFQAAYGLIYCREIIVFMQHAYY